jgi:hypothetical protein
MAKHVTSIARVAFNSIINPRTSDFGKTSWDVGVVLTEKDSQSIFQAIEDEVTRYRDTNAKGKELPSNDKLKMPWRQSVRQNEDGEKVPVEGEFLWVFKRPVSYPDRRNGGEMKNTPPLIYDSMGKIVDGLQEVPNQTTGKVVYEVGIYNRMGNSGVTLRLVGFQIAEMGAGSGVDLTPIEGGTFVAEEDSADIGAVLGA